jgi:hypothetical protein
MNGALGSQFRIRRRGDSVPGMAFDAGHRPDPRPGPMRQDGIDWLDVVTRAVGVCLFLVFYLLWLGHQVSGVWMALGFN